MEKADNQQIVPGIFVTSKGQATVDPSLQEVLFDLALKLEEPLDLPVDVQHVLAAIVLAARSGELDSCSPLAADDPRLVTVLSSHVRRIFSEFGGKVGKDD